MVLRIGKRAGEGPDALGVEHARGSGIDPRVEALAQRVVHVDDDTIRRVRVLLIAAVLCLSACVGAVKMPRQPWEDIPVPARWVAYSRDSVIIETPAATTAKLIYFAETSVDQTLGQARQLLTQAGWTETKSERFVNPEKFPGVWAEFAKGGDVCRVAVIEGAHATNVDYTVARVNRAR